MGKFTETKRYDEPGDRDTLYFSPSFYQDGVLSQSLAIAPAEDTVSLVGLQIRSSATHGNDYFHVWLLPEEVDMVIEGLLKAKDNIIKGD